MIHGYFDEQYPSNPRPIVRSWVFIPDYSTTWALVPFLIDTGASKTALEPGDAIFRVGIDPIGLARPGSWPRTESLGGIGGNALYYPVAAWYSFGSDPDGYAEPFQAEIRVAQLTMNNQAIPSLLGWDILQKFELTTNWQTKEVKLRML